MDREEKKALFEERKKRGLIPLLAAALVLVAAAGAGAWFLRGAGGNTVTPVNGQIVLPLAEVSDGKAHFYTFRSGGTEIRFFVLKSQDGVVRAAFDTCDVCYKAKKGYRQEGSDMVCNNCDQRFRADQINEIRGGCNPSPLNRTLAGDRLLIAETDLTQGAWYFQ